MEQIIRIGMDTSKSVFQLHGVNAAEHQRLFFKESTYFVTEVCRIFISQLNSVCNSVFSRCVDSGGGIALG